MARNRLPNEVAAVTGAAEKNPKRFRGRSAPAVPPLGKPSDWLDAAERQAWAGFQLELPWLMESDRAMVELASVVRAKVRQGTGGAAAITELRLLLSALAASPVARSKVSVPAEPKVDPANEFLN